MKHIWDTNSEYSMNLCLSDDKLRNELGTIKNI